MEIRLIFGSENQVLWYPIRDSQFIGFSTIWIFLQETGPGINRGDSQVHQIVIRISSIIRIICLSVFRDRSTLVSEGWIMCQNLVLIPYSIDG